MRIEFAAHAFDRALRDSCRQKKRFLCHAEIARRVIGRHTAFIAKSEMKSFPRLLLRDASKLTINGLGCISAGEGDAKRAAFGQRSACVLQEKLRRFRR